MEEDVIATQLNESVEERDGVNGQGQTTGKPGAKQLAPKEQTIEEYEAEMDRLASEFEEEAERWSGGMYTPEDEEHDIEFGRLEAARDEHFAQLRKTDAEKPKYPPSQYLVDGLLPMNEVHVIAGETGAGKSTWLLDNFINPWQHEKPIFGRNSHWFPYVILVNDRSEAGMIRTLQRLGLHPKQFPIKSTITGSKTTLAEKIEAFHDANPALKVVFIEGLHVGQKEGNDYGESSEVMQELNALCQRRKLTIIATTHVSKSNAQLGMADRTSIIGSSATPGMCETVLVLAKQKKGGRIKLTVHPRNEKALTQLYKWTDQGKLVETEDDEDQDRFVVYLNQVPTQTFKTEDAVAFYERRFKVGRDTAQNEIKRAITKKWIEPVIDEETGKAKKGHYKKVEVEWGGEEN